MRIFMLTMVTPFNSTSATSKRAWPLSIYICGEVERGRNALNTISTSADVPRPAWSAAASVSLLARSFNIHSCGMLEALLLCQWTNNSWSSRLWGSWGKGRGFGYKQGVRVCIEREDE